MKKNFSKIIKEVAISTVCKISCVIAALGAILLFTIVLAWIAGQIISIITGDNWPIVLLCAIVIVSIFVTELMKYKDDVNTKK